MIFHSATPEDVGRRGEAIFEKRIRPQLGESSRGKYVTIDVETGDYVIGDDWTIQPNMLHEKRPGALLYTLRVGYSSVSSIGFAQVAASDL
jgi:hypothetical protein